MTPSFSLIQVHTSDDIQLSGLYQPGDKNKTAAIFIHGFTTDFYTHPFYHAIARSLQERGNALILAQHRGTGLYTEFLKKDGSSRFIGSYYERLADAHLDISAFVEFLQEQGYTNIALIGHSLGTMKVIRYLFEGQHKDAISKLLLLAPFDKNAYMHRKAPGKLAGFVNKAEEMVAQGKGEEIVPLPEFEDYPMSYQTYVSWYEDTQLNNMCDFSVKKYDFPTFKQIGIPTKIVLGEKDEFVDFPDFGVSAQSVLDTMKKHIPHCETTLIKDSDHCYVGHEDEVGKEVAGFLQ